MPTTADFLITPSGRYYHASLRCPMDRTGFILKWGIRFRLVGVGFGVVTGGLFARLVLPHPQVRCGSLWSRHWGERGNCCSASD